MSILDTIAHSIGVACIKYQNAGEITNLTATNNFVTNTDEGFVIYTEGTGVVNSQIHENSITNNVSYAIHNYSAVSQNATCNWYGTIDNTVIASKISGPVVYIPYLTSGTDDSDDPGFQPVPGSCNGYSYTACKQGKDDGAIMCRDGKEKCVKLKDVEHNAHDGWTLGHCASPCKANETLMCRNGQEKCFKTSDVPKKQAEGWVIGHCTVDENVSPNMSVDEDQVTPVEYKVSNYPNPFSRTTTIKYEVPQDSKVNITVYNMMGRPIATIVEAEKKAGIYTVEFDGTKLNSGMYYYKMTAISAGKVNTATQKLLLAK